MEDRNYLLVDASVLPDVFLRVVQAKHLLATGKAKNLSDAADMTEISRSTLYKYKDHVFAYDTAMARDIATVSLELEHRAGVLSAVLAALSDCGANILTINQNIPVDGVAPVSISMRIDSASEMTETIVLRLAALGGVVNVRLLSS